MGSILECNFAFCCVQARGFVESLEMGSSNSADVGLVRSVLAAGFYPQVCTPHSEGVISAQWCFDASGAT